MARRYRDAMPPPPPATGGYSFESIRLAPLSLVTPTTVGALTPAGDGHGMVYRPVPAPPDRTPARAPPAGAQSAAVPGNRDLLLALSKLGYAPEVAKFALSLGDPTFRVAVMDYARRKPEEVMASLEESAIQALKGEDLTAAFWLLNVLGRIGLLVGRVEHVLAFAKHAADTARETSAEVSAVTLMNYGALLSHANHRDEARAVYYDALEALKRPTR